MKPYAKVASIVAVCGAALAVMNISPACAQCATCATPVVAYSPVVAPATTVTYEPVRGWYPGKLLDTWRMRRWGYTAPVAVTAAYAPTYSVGYAPAYSAAYAPTVTTAAYAPYTVGYAPAVTSTSYSMPYVTSYAPLGQRQVLMRPVVMESAVVATAPVVSAGCSTCAVEAPCSACSACEPCSSCAATTVVEQAAYTQAAPCTNCAQGSTITYADQPPVGSTETTQPSMTPQEAAPLKSNYPDVTPPQNSQQQDPGPAAEDKAADSNTYLEPPALFSPGDRTAGQPKPVNRSPSVNVWNAVYRDGATADNVSTTVARSQAEIDAQGWHSVTE